MTDSVTNYVTFIYGGSHEACRAPGARARRLPEQLGKAIPLHEQTLTNCRENASVPSKHHK